MRHSTRSPHLAPSPPGDPNELRHRIVRHAIAGLRRCRTAIDRGAITLGLTSVPGVPPLDCRTATAIALVMIIAAGAWLLPATNPIPSTYAVAIGLALGAVFVTLNSWRNALPTGTVAQLLQKTEASDRPSRLRGSGNDAVDGR